MGNLFNSLGVGEDGVTGLLMTFQKHAVHLLECNDKMVLEVLRDLKKHMASSKALISDCKIILHITDVPSRIFPLWSHRALTSANSGDPVGAASATITAPALAALSSSSAVSASLTSASP